jgi:precorrin-4 C11-methyltransferase
VRVHAAIREDRILWFRPKSLVLGVGCERGITEAALEDGLQQFLQSHHFARSSIQALASIDVKSDETALLVIAEKNGWATIYYSAAELAAVTGAPNPSEVVEKCVGTPGVAEPAALLAAGARELLVEKQVVTSALAPQRMTFALARLSTHSPAADKPGKVVFIGAGPGDPELLTVKARTFLQRADVVVYAGSLIPEAVLRHAPGTAQVVNSMHLTLEQVMDYLIEPARAGKRVVRLQSGDTSLYSAIQEQMTRLDEAGIEYEVIPGVSAFQAAAAALKAELTLPEVVQTIILTRAEGETRMPEGEALESLARHNATLCIFLSARLAESVQEQLLTAYPPETPTAILYRVSWPEEKIVVTELRHLAAEMKQLGFTRSTLIVVGTAVAGRRNRSRLYDKTHGHLFRARHRGEEGPATERHS